MDDAQRKRFTGSLSYRYAGNVMHRIKAVWFDLDDTLYDHTHSVCHGLDEIRRRYPALGNRSSQALAILYNRALNAVYSGYLRGEINFHEMRRRKLKLFYESAEVDENQLPAMDEFHCIYDEAYGNHRRATPGSVEVLHRVAEGGMALAILTNGRQEIQEEKLRRIGLEWMVPNLLTSEQAGAPKPDPRIYEWALERTGQAAENVLMAGDSLENDVEGALRCGLNAVWYAPGTSQQTVSTSHGPARVIQEWRSLYDLIGDARTLSARP